MIATASLAGKSLDELDVHILAALQMNGRASWRQIAAVIGAPERTVVTHGTELIRSGIVRISGMTLLPAGGLLDQCIVSLQCASGMNRVAATSASTRPDTVFTFLTTGENDCVFELMTEHTNIATVLLDEIPSIPGVARSSTVTVIKLYKGIHQWIPIHPTAEAFDQLRDPDQRWSPLGGVELPPLNREEQDIARVLAADGRATIEELARAAALSPSSARRKLAQMQRSGRLYIRAIVEPTTLGFPVNAVLRIRTMPQHIDRVARILEQIPEVRYLALTTGRHQLFAEIACGSQAQLNHFLFRDDWTEHSLEVETSLLIDALKRSGIRKEHA